MATTEHTAKMGLHQRFTYYVQVLGWTYISDPTTWTGGIWYHDSRGSVNNSGGTFPNITRAVEAMDRHYKNAELEAKHQEILLARYA